MILMLSRIAAGSSLQIPTSCLAAFIIQSTTFISPCSSAAVPSIHRSYQTGESRGQHRCSTAMPPYATEQGSREDRQRGQKKQEAGAPAAGMGRAPRTAKWESSDAWQDDMGLSPQEVQRIQHTVLRQTQVAESFLATLLRAQSRVLHHRPDAAFFSEQEQQQLARLSQLLPQHRARPSLLLPAVRGAGALLGLAAAVLPPSSRNLVLGAVHGALEEQLNSRLRELLDLPQTDQVLELKAAIKQLRDTPRAATQSHFQPQPQPPPTGGHERDSNSVCNYFATDTVKTGESHARPQCMCDVTSKQGGETPGQGDFCRGGQHHQFASDHSGGSRYRKGEGESAQAEGGNPILASLLKAENLAKMVIRSTMLSISALSAKL